MVSSTKDAILKDYRYRERLEKSGWTTLQKRKKEWEVIKLKLSKWWNF